MGEPVVVAVVGPTASGKSDLAVALARRLGGDVVNTDSMQVYLGMDIGTAKVPPEARGGIRHHLLDLWPVTRTVTVAEFQALARAEIEECRAAGRTPVLVGGSALYVRAILDRFEFPGTDPAVRQRLEDDLATVGPGAMHARLAAVDPQSAAQILPTNGRRIVRALEVMEITGRPFTASLPAREYAVPGTVQLGLDVPRDVLDERIALRVDRMWEQGFVDEVRRLAARRTARGAHRQPGSRLCPGAALPRRRVDGGAGPRRDRTSDSAVCAAAGQLVPQGRADRLAAVRCP